MISEFYCPKCKRVWLFTNDKRGQAREEHKQTCDKRENQ